MDTTGSTPPRLTLSQHLNSIFPPPASAPDGAVHPRKQLTTTILPALLEALSQIATALSGAHTVALAGTANTFGDDQLNVDVLAEQILRDTLATACRPYVVTASSEEDPVEKTVSATSAAGEGEEQYTVAFDPLDGSSIIAPNWTVGTILGIWDGATAIGQSPRERQVVSLLGVYGPRTTAIVAIRTPDSDAAVSTCFEVAVSASASSSSLGDSSSGSGEYEVLRPNIQLAPPPFRTRYFAPANLRAAGQDARYLGLVNRYIAEGCTLRYSGGLVPDVVHALVKGHGVYVSPVTRQSQAKLRRLYELLPLALVVECAGGAAIDPADGRRILDVALANTDERAGLVCGTAEEVELVKRALLG